MINMKWMEEILMVMLDVLGVLGVFMIKVFFYTYLYIYILLKGWKERPIFGKIRYMNYNGCKRKFDIESYIKMFSFIKYK